MRVYAFLSQIFDYGNTDIEKRFIFFKRLIPLLEFGRERDIVDLSKVVLTHHNLKNRGKQSLSLGEEGEYKLAPMDEVGSGAVHEKEKGYLDEIIRKVNGLFEGELSDNDQLVYVNGVLMGKLLENETLVRQAATNSKEQFANSPDLADALMKIDAFARGIPMPTAEAHPETGQMMIMNPLSGGGLRGLFSTHPATEERVAKLRAMAQRR